jgi:hypothetical protein
MRFMRTDPDPMDMVLRIVAATLTLTTAAVHLSLGGLLFVANGVGYAILAGAIVLPVRLAARFRFLVRLALLGFTTATIVGWVLVGGRFPLAYADKAVELVLIVILVVDLRRADGGIVAAIRRSLGIVPILLGRRPAADPAPAASK